MKKIYLSLFLGALLTGCGSGDINNSVSTTINVTSATNTPTSKTNTQSETTSENTIKIVLLSPSDINLTKDIQEGKITDYDANDPIEVQYLSIVNYVRSLNLQCNDDHAAVGPAAPLEWNTLLENSAREHSEDMHLSEHYGHDGSGTDFDITAGGLELARGSTPFERMTYNGYDYMTAGENVAMKATTGALGIDTWIEIMEAWINSNTGHCSNIMSSYFTEFGMVESRGRAEITYPNGMTRESSVAYWTQNFGKPQ